MKIEHLNEVHVNDAYPKQFQIMIKKYKKLSSSVRSNLYVQFTDHASSTIEKTAFGNPSHNDFVGVYGYPINYVLNYSMDIWYASKAKYARVIKDKGSYNTLNMNQISHEEAIRLLGSLNHLLKTEYTDDTLKNIIKNNRYTGKNKWSRAFLFLIQNNVDENLESTGIRSGKDQTKLVRELGAGVIVDSAKSHTTATINDREPEQIIFLSRGAFDVVEVFDLKQEVDTTSSNVTGYSIDKDAKYMRKLAAKIAHGIGTKLSDHTIDEGYYIFWTERGDSIFLRPVHQSSSYVHREDPNIKFGQKPHKVNKQNNYDVVNVSLYSDHGTIKYTPSDSEQIDYISKEIIDIYKSNELDTTFVPSNKESYIQKREEKKSQERKSAFNEREKEIYENNLRRYNTLLLPILEYYGKDELIALGTNKGADIFKILHASAKRNKTPYDYKEDIDKRINSIDNKITKMSARQKTFGDVADEEYPLIVDLVNSVFDNRMYEQPFPMYLNSILEKIKS